MLVPIVPFAAALVIMMQFCTVHSCLHTHTHKHTVHTQPEPELVKSYGRRLTRMEKREEKREREGEREEGWANEKKWKESASRKIPFPLLHAEWGREEAIRRMAEWQTSGHKPKPRGDGSKGREGRKSERVREKEGEGEEKREGAEYVIKAVITRVWNHFSQ